MHLRPLLMSMQASDLQAITDMYTRWAEALHPAMHPEVRATLPTTTSASQMAVLHPFCLNFAAGYHHSLLGSSYMNALLSCRTFCTASRAGLARQSSR